MTPRLFSKKPEAVAQYRLTRAANQIQALRRPASSVRLIAVILTPALLTGLVLTTLDVAHLATPINTIIAISLLFCFSFFFPRYVPSFNRPNAYRFFRRIDSDPPSAPTRVWFSWGLLLQRRPDRPALRVAHELIDVHASDDLADHLYDARDEGAYALQGLVRDALAVPYSRTFTEAVSPSSYAARTLAALDQLDGVAGELEVFVEAITSTLATRWRVWDVATKNPPAIRALEALANFYQELASDPDALALAREAFVNYHDQIFAGSVDDFEKALTDVSTTTRRLLRATRTKPAST